ncbi:MAG TPA: outer membrane lipoprotein chaperone LolA [Blastocatellia bacterium]|jgi:outer membrane lipoprotein carrier protein|nr:outer membrane lipoprotein chaperone LolA [Blastocatellia bacterium]
MSQLFIRPALMLAFLSFSALAVSAQSQSELDRAINGLQSKYNKISTLSADFAQVHSDRGQSERRESGRLLLKKPGKMKWNYTKPEEKLFISDGKWLYEYASADNYATRSSVKDSEDLRAPFAFLLGQGNLRNEFRRIEFAKESPINAGNKVLRMLPRHLQDFDELLIEFDPNSFEMSRLSIIKSGDERSDFIFSNVRENVVATSAEFTFKAPPGVEVRDN